jgi:hypothetical protein
MTWFYLPASFFLVAGEARVILILDLLLISLAANPFSTHS